MHNRHGHPKFGFFVEGCLYDFEYGFTKLKSLCMEVDGLWLCDVTSASTVTYFLVCENILTTTVSSGGLPLGGAKA